MNLFKYIFSFLKKKKIGFKEKKYQNVKQIDRLLYRFLKEQKEYNYLIKNDGLLNEFHCVSLSEDVVQIMFRRFDLYQKFSILYGSLISEKYRIFREKILSNNDKDKISEPIFIPLWQKNDYRHTHNFLKSYLMGRYNYNAYGGDIVRINKKWVKFLIKEKIL